MPSFHTDLIWRTDIINLQICFHIFCQTSLALELQGLWTSQLHGHNPKNIEGGGGDEIPWFFHDLSRFSNPLTSQTDWIKGYLFTRFSLIFRIAKNPVTFFKPYYQNPPSGLHTKQGSYHIGFL